MGFKVGNPVSKSMTKSSFPHAQFALRILEFEKNLYLGKNIVMSSVIHEIKILLNHSTMSY